LKTKLFWDQRTSTSSGLRSSHFGGLQSTNI